MNSDFMSVVSSLLSNPGALDALRGIVESADGTRNSASQSSASPTSFLPPSFSKESEPQKNALKKLQNPFDGTAPFFGGKQDKNVALLNALTPYMRSERAAKIGSAIKAIRVIGMLSSLK